MVNQFSVSDEWVIRIACYDAEALNRVLALAWEMATRSSLEKLPKDELEDLIYDVLFDVVIAVKDGMCKTGEDLLYLVECLVSEKVDHPIEFPRDDFDISDRIDWLTYWVVKTPPVPDSTILLYRDGRSWNQETRSRIDLITIDDELIKYLKTHPKKMYELSPRRFEELVGAILRDQGYSVELTAGSADGGIDILATRKSEVGEILLVVDCKRFAQRRPVGVGIVRTLFGVGEQKRATIAMLATTSFFTRPAQEFQRTLQHRLSLKDYNDLVTWLDNYGLRDSPGGR